MKILPSFTRLLFVLILALVVLWPGPVSAGTNQSAQDQPARLRSQPVKKKATATSTAALRPADELRATRKKLKALQPFRAKIKETIVIRGRTFQATGRYVQGADLKLNLSFEINAGRTKGSLIQVCDGQFLWTRHQIGKSITATKRDVKRVLKELASLSRTTGPVPQPGQFEADLGLGGLDALLASLEQSMVFDVRRERTIQKQRFVVIEGTWNAQFLTNLTDQEPGQSNELPEYIPDRVRIYLEGTTGFPKRIDYLKRGPNRKSLRPMVTLEFQEIEIHIKADANTFRYKPEKGVNVQDVTDQFLQQLRQLQSPSTRPTPPSGSKRGSAAGSRP